MALLLPPDAVVRNLELKEAQPPVFVLEYTLPGDPVERENFRRIEILVPQAPPSSLDGAPFWRS